MKKNDTNEWWYLVGLAIIVRFIEVVFWTMVLLPFGWLFGRALARSARWWRWAWISVLGSAILTAAAMLVAPQSIAQMWDAGLGFTVEHPLLVAQGLGLQLPAVVLIASLRAVLDRWALRLRAQRRQRREQPLRGL